MAPDDWTAILYLVKRNDIDVKVITISGTGEAHGKKGAKNCLRLLELVNKSDVPVAYGKSEPLGCSHRFPRIMRFAVDRRLLIKFPKTKKKPKELNAINLMKQIINKTQEKVGILAIGPLTNLANFLKKFPEFKKEIEKIYIMGGAVDVKGNIQDVRKSIDNPYAEWNIYCDPHAANIVFQSGIPILLVPLDATNQLPIDNKFIQKLRNHKENKICEFCLKIMKRFGSRIEKGNIALWDLVAATIVYNEDIVEKEIRKVRVVEKEGSESGRIIDDADNGAKIEICKEIDKKEYFKRFFDTILS